MEPATSTRLLRHIAAAIGFAALAVVWTYPLARHGSTHILGGGAGDNVAFLWNFWWMRAALEANLAFFRTDYLFVPTGVDLILHTHTALPAFVGATALGKLPVVAALNATVLFAIFLSAFGAYLLAWRITRSHSAAAVAGLIFGGSPFMSAHLNGHFNLTSAWTVPLFAFAISEALTRKSPRWSVAAGLVLGMTVYVDYYLFVYEAVLAACLLAIEAVEWSVSSSDRTPRSRMLVRIMAFLVVAGFLCAGRHLPDGRIHHRIAGCADFGTHCLQSTSGTLAFRGGRIVGSRPTAGCGDATGLIRRSTNRQHADRHRGRVSGRGGAGVMERNGSSPAWRIRHAALFLAQRTERHRHRDVGAR